jgi:hypothetical protein
MMMWRKAATEPFGPLFRPQPEASRDQSPVASDCFFRYLQHSCRFFHAETGEVSEFDNAGFALVGIPQLIESIVESDQPVVPCMT